MKLFHWKCLVKTKILHLFLEGWQPRGWVLLDLLSSEEEESEAELVVAPITRFDGPNRRVYLLFRVVLSQHLTLLDLRDIFPLASTLEKTSLWKRNSWKTSEPLWSGILSWSWLVLQSQLHTSWFLTQLSTIKGEKHLMWFGNASKCWNYENGIHWVLEVWKAEQGEITPQ